MELPFNTTISKDLLKGTHQFDEPVADWPTKRRWVAGGVRGARGRRLRRGQRLHRGQGPRADAASSTATPVAGRRHVRPRRGLVRPRQRRPHAEPRHLGDVQRRRSAAASCRSAAPTEPSHEERMIRELVLQLKRGSIRPAYFRDKYGVDILERFDGAARVAARPRATCAQADAELVALSREGLLRVDVAAPALLPARAPGHSVHLERVVLAAALLGARGRVIRMRKASRSIPTTRREPQRRRRALSARCRLRPGGHRRRRRRARSRRAGSRCRTGRCSSTRTT